MTQPWHILGAGSMGCLWAANLKKLGHEPCLLLRPDRYQAMSAHPTPLICTSPEGAVESHQLRISSTASVEAGISKLLVSTKAGDALEAVKSVQHKLIRDCHILLLQNGMDSQQEIARALPDASIWAASTTEGAWLKAPLHVCHAGRGATWIGPLGKLDPERREEFESSLVHSPLKIHFTSQIETRLWEKLAINCAINGLTALYDCRNGQLLDGGIRQNTMNRLIEETIRVMTALKLPTSTLHDTVRQVCEKTANNFSSTCMDRKLQRKTELDAINGFLIRQADKLDVPVPSHKELMSALAALGVTW